MKEHLKGNEFTQYIDQELEPDQLSEIKTHLDSCPPCADELNQFRAIKIRLNRIPQRMAPEALIQSLKKRYGSEPNWWRKIAAWMVPVPVWKPVTIAALIAVVTAMVLINKLSHKEEEFVDMDSLLVAHAKYQGESMVPEADMSQSNYSMRLASFYRDEN